jgi:SAM-dependent methyltransferase
VAESANLPNNESRAVISNRALWNNLARVHVKSAFYDVAGFLEGKTALTEIELALLGDIEGQTILHLQCHFGLGTLSLSRLGALATGVDFAGEAISLAKELNQKAGLNATFVECDVNELDKFLDAKFDVVFASFGVIGWHADLTKWCRMASHFLKPGGRFVFAEFHPAFWMLDESTMKVGYSYFRAEPIIEERQKSYAEPDAGAFGTSYCWNHGLGEFFQLLNGEGIWMDDFQEYDYSPYPIFQAVAEKHGRYYIKGFEHKVPLVYSITGRKKDHC